MTYRRGFVPRRPALAGAALGALMLAGCSTGHVGESWQCPLAEGGLCDSVAAADPAVPDPGARAVAKEPLWRVRGSVPEAPPARGSASGTGGGPGRASVSACAAECDGGFDPFGWLLRLFADADGGDGPEAADRGAAAPEPGPESAPGSAASAPASPTTTPRPEEPGAVPAQVPAAAALPGEPPSLRAGPAPDEARAGDLRTGEVVARIWIAPFVDAGGVYREASWVRVVLEPAGWRLRR